MRPPVSRTPTHTPAPNDWAELPDEALLNLRLCDLPVAIAGSWLEDRVAALNAELDARGLAFRPYF